MTDEEIKQLEVLLQGGIKWDKVAEYQRYFFLITGKRRHGGCTHCEGNYLYNYLSSYIKALNKQKK
jgi:hypothetical protein